jgi:hypothetical protein
MHRGLLAYVVAIIVVIIAAYLYTGFRFLPFVKNAKITTTVNPIISGTTTIQTSSTTTVIGSTINSSIPVTSCSHVNIIGQAYSTTYTEFCNSSGGTFGLWVAAGNSGMEHVSIVGANNRTYVNQTSKYYCTTFYQNFTGPAQLYKITYETGPGGGICGNSQIIINTTTTPPLVVYSDIYNGNFGSGEYTGWNMSSPGFGSTPFNISYANKKICYQGRPWSNYNGSYFATTYNCGTTTSPGNLTSSPFIVSPSNPFLNFRLISPQDNNLYVEVLLANYKIVNGQQMYINSTPVEIAHFNTFNNTITQYPQSTFANVTLPLTLYVNKPVEIRLVAREYSSSFIAAGDFVTSNKPSQDRGIAENITFTN